MHIEQQVIGGFGQPLCGYRDWTNKYAETVDPPSDLPASVEEFVHPEKRYPWLKWQ
jgi:hypothetical protein